MTQQLKTIETVFFLQFLQDYQKLLLENCETINYKVENLLKFKLKNAVIFVLFLL